MYNRYVPQPDGSFRRNYVPDPCPPAPPKEPSREMQSPQESCPQQMPIQAESSPPKKHPGTQRPRYAGQRRDEGSHAAPAYCPKSQNVGSFLKNLLPKDFDTGDFFVLLMLLLMAGDCEEDKNTALLTLMLYLFL